MPAAALLSAGGSQAFGAEFDVDVEVSGYADTDHVAVLTPALTGTLTDAARGLSASGDAIVDIVSGASVDIVSTASERWTEVREAADLSVDYKPQRIGVSLSGGVSREPDYLSWSLGAVVRAELDDSHVTPSLGYAFSSDTAGRSGTPYSVFALRSRRHTAQAGVELVLNRSSRLALLIEAMFESGRQEKPYRFLPLFSAASAALVSPGQSIQSVNALRLSGRVDERVPEDRRRFAATADWALRADNSTLRVNERLYADSWGLLATTTDLRWIVDAGSRWSVWPHVRFHAQNAADFWRLTYVGEVTPGNVQVPSLRSGDRELSPLWTGALGFGAEFHLDARPLRGWAFRSVLEGSQTRFLDALFIERRYAALLVLSAGCVF